MYYFVNVKKYAKRNYSSRAIDEQKYAYAPNKLYTHTYTQPHTHIQGDLKKSWFSVLEGYPVKIYKTNYIFRYMNTHYFLIIKPNSNFKSKGAFYGNKFSKSSCFAFFYENY